ncbi:hypothetical protein IU397_13825, partial [Actibacterium sp. 188UL27-1]
MRQQIHKMPFHQLLSVFTITLAQCVDQGVMSITFVQLQDHFQKSLGISRAISLASSSIISSWLRRPSICSSKAVHRRVFWHQMRLKLRESLAHLVGLIMRRAGGDASGAFRAS